MTKCFEGDLECTELVLRIVMERPDLVVQSVKVQSPYKNLQGRSLTLDIDATDSKGRRFDIEVQRADSGATPRRARYHASVMDANTLQVQEDFEILPELYVIFYYGA
ncbi:MAG: PD-(D/E)XK nuclease family transposase [Schwartzia sp.]|nr:PD-(D/E)XK nuclease family transposase [Schwartzia sp. (in: firmicutes)]